MPRISSETASALEEEGLLMSSSRNSNKFHWKRWLRPIILTLYFLTLVLAVPVVVWQLQRHNWSIHTKAWFIAGISVLFTLPVSLWGILQHVVHLSRPDLQKPIIRILWMVPIFSLASWGCLLWPDHATYLETLREFYEAFVIYSFMGLLANFVQAQYPSLEAILEAKGKQRFPFPFCWCPPHQAGQRVLCRCKLAVLQHITIRLFSSVIAAICEFLHVYKHGTISVSSAWLYLAILNGVSETFAVYSLVVLHQTLKEELKPIQPVGKFVCMKLVLFLTNWQGVIIAGLLKSHVISETSTWDWQTAKAVGAGLQNFALCMEMFVAAIVFQYSYSYTPYMKEQRRGTFWSFFWEIWDVSDITEDVVAQAMGFTECLCGSTKALREPHGLCDYVFCNI
ncbi:transmembrane protein 184C-like [Suncus etruscus]|uniref:transmembrane protein 184C-like n=1 Tax=Suncus etruscus TaxID=109475 RepID=UPI0021104591|nr:transmembrane protein 184C-like [Suncus etruscus]